MAYIDTNELFKCETCIRYKGNKCLAWCENGKRYSPNMKKIPTADVVPKSEVDRLNAVMKEMDEQRAYSINMLGESLEKAKAEVEEISGKYEDLKLKHLDLAKDHDELIAWGGHIKSTERAEIEKVIARKIFEEIERFLYIHFRFCKEEIGNDDTEYVKGRMELNTQIQDFIAELKKKYTEQKKG